MSERRDEQQHQAVEGATADRLLDGVIHDAHGEIQIDPDASDEPDPRRDVAAIESHDERADDETRGSVDDPPRPEDRGRGERPAGDRPNV